MIRVRETCPIPILLIFLGSAIVSSLNDSYPLPVEENPPEAAAPGGAGSGSLPGSCGFRLFRLRDFHLGARLGVKDQISVAIIDDDLKASDDIFNRVTSDGVR